MVESTQYEIAGIKIGEGTFDVIVKSKFNENGEFFSFDISKIDNVDEWRKVIEDSIIIREVELRKFGERMKDKTVSQELESIKAQSVGTYDITSKIEKRLAKELADGAKGQELLDKVNQSEPT